MIVNRTKSARQQVGENLGNESFSLPAPRAALFSRSGLRWSIGFALALMMLPGIPPATGSPLDLALDRDGNGIEDVLDRWRVGVHSWEELRGEATKRADRARLELAAAGESSTSALDESGSWEQGLIRVLCLGDLPEFRAKAAKARSVGTCTILHEIPSFGGVNVLAVDEAGLTELLSGVNPGRILLDRDGVPALDRSRRMIGRAPSPDLEAVSYWNLGDDWSCTVAILDSGCDSAHGDLGDATDDDVDGPPPEVGDASDWYPANGAWPLFGGYKIVGWHDVTDDFPLAQGPWDYHHHGTALASAVAGAGNVNPDLEGVAAGTRLTVVKFYDFDGVWHAWAGDFLAACAWTLENRDTYRIRTVLMAVNWETNAGIGAAVQALAEAGMVPVAAAGNHGSAENPYLYPASLPEVLTAGSVNDEGALSAFSGRAWTGIGKPDLVAPGGGLRIEHGRIDVADNEPDDSYSGRWGTSLAAAQTAGAVQVLDEAMRESGLILDPNLDSVGVRKSVLRMTTAIVDRMEDPSGQVLQVMAPYDGHDNARGWGLLRVDAAVDAMLRPLLPGKDQLDTLTVNLDRPVVARRLGFTSDIRYLVEAVPTPGLDVSLELVDPQWLSSDPEGSAVIRINSQGPGVSEFGYLRPVQDRWYFLVVKRITGEGNVTLKLRESDAFTEQAGLRILPGLASGGAVPVDFPGYQGPSLAVPSRVEVDQVARSLNILDGSGNYRSGWPVFVFPHPSSLGGLNQPMAMDLDGQPGDELVVTSEFGSVYFFTEDGEYDEVVIQLNRSLTPAVGWALSGSPARAVAVDKLGWVRSWSHGGVLEAERDFGHSLPLSPAVGQLTFSLDEEAVLSFSDGHVTAVDRDLVDLPGWPVELGSDLELAPILLDIDSDGLHEIFVPLFDAASGLLSVRVLHGNGQVAAGDGTVIPAPVGGRWVRISPAVVAGGYATGDVGVRFIGLASNGLPEDANRWHFAEAGIRIGGQVFSRILGGFIAGTTTDQGILTLDGIRLPAPVAWNQEGAAQTETAVLVSIQWHELLYGLTSIPGSATAWLGPRAKESLLFNRQPLTPGGGNGLLVSFCASTLIPVRDDLMMRVEVLDDSVGLIPVRTIPGSDPPWIGARGDTRSSGSYRLNPRVASVLPVGQAGMSLNVFPNPGPGRIRFRLRGPAGSGIPLDSVDVYDLRGRRVIQLGAASPEGVMSWDGRDARGRIQAAGTYLAVARSGSAQVVSRLVLTR